METNHTQTQFSRPIRSKFGDHWETHANTCTNIHRHTFAHLAAAGAQKRKSYVRTDLLTHLQICARALRSRIIVKAFAHNTFDAVVPCPCRWCHMMLVMRPTDNFERIMYRCRNRGWMDDPFGLAKKMALRRGFYVEWWFAPEYCVQHLLAHKNRFCIRMRSAQYSAHFALLTINTHIRFACYIFMLAHEWHTHTNWARALLHNFDCQKSMSMPRPLTHEMYTHIYVNFSCPDARSVGLVFFQVYICVCVCVSSRAGHLDTPNVYTSTWFQPWCDWKRRWEIVAAIDRDMLAFAVSV